MGGWTDEKIQVAVIILNLVIVSPGRSTLLRNWGFYLARIYVADGNCKLPVRSLGVIVIRGHCYIYPLSSGHALCLYGTQQHKVTHLKYITQPAGCLPQEHTFQDADSFEGIIMITCQLLHFFVNERFSS